MSSMRKPLYLAVDGADIFPQEMAITDEVTLGGLTMGGAIAMGTHKITGMGDGTLATDAATFGQVEALVAGLSWKEPVLVVDMLDDSDEGGTPPTAQRVGDARVVDNWGIGYTDGDIVEWDGSAWQVILANSAGAPPDGTRVLVAGPPSGTVGGSFTGQEEDIATYNTGTSTWTFETPVKSWAVLVSGTGSYGENEGYTYNGTDWVQFTGTATLIAGDGLSKSGNTISVNFGDGIRNDSDYVAIDLLDTNPGLQLVGATGNQRELAVLDGDGIAIDANGVKVNLSTSNPGLELIGTAGAQTLQAKLNANGGIQVDGSGLAIKIDDTPDTLDVGSAGLKVVGLPALFKINDVAVGATVTAANLDELTDGSVTTLHAHAGADAAERVQNVIAVSEALAIADPVYWSSTNNQVGKGDAADNVKSRISGLAVTAQATPGSTATIVSHGAAVGVLSGATAGTPYYLQSTGGIGTTVPSGNVRVILVGWAKNATDLWVSITDYGKKAA